MKHLKSRALRGFSFGAAVKAQPGRARLYGCAAAGQKKVWQPGRARLYGAVG